jgi:hypothetical protein
VTYDDIRKHFGSVEKARVALGLKSRQTLFNWRDDAVPPGWQARIQLATEGRLMADPAVIALTPATEEQKAPA